VAKRLGNAGLAEPVARKEGNSIEGGGGIERLHLRSLYMEKEGGSSLHTTSRHLREAAETVWKESKLLFVWARHSRKNRGGASRDALRPY